MITIQRETKETKICVKLGLYASEESDISTGIGFFDHMLNAFAKHAAIHLVVHCEGDLYVDFHHSVEDVGIALGEAFAQAIFPISRVERFGEASVVMDEALVQSVIDLSGRPFLHFDLGDLRGKIGEFDAELAEEFFRALVYNAKISAHIVKQRGYNLHHIVEGAFKSFAVALRRALVKNEALGVPSTKGVL